MPEIILASRSPQRKKLFDLLGIKYHVKPSGADECEKVTTSCAALVKHNALLKARDIAAREKSAIVIGCDTVVYLGNGELVLKPKSLAEAKRKLKKLMARPQWVYSGLALINSRTGRELIDYEKTKVFMHVMSDKEISAYHRRVPPLDKAGGFDIEGLGSIFIHRIEGCYTNVIGLPMAKLRLMLKKMGVSVLGAACVFFCGACTSEFNLAKGEQRSYIYGTEKEVSIGSKVAGQIIEKEEMLNDVDATVRIENIVRRLAEVSDRKDVVYSVRVIDDSEEDDPIINAMALPGGYIFVYKGLIDFAKSDDELAGVLAHEIGHVTARHGIERLQKSYLAMALQGAAIATESPGVGGGTSFALSAMMLNYSRQDEFEADRLAVRYMQRAGYDPTKMLDFLERLKEEHDKEIRSYSYWKTHPHIPQRIANIRKEITGEMDFRDYIQLIGAEEEIR